MSLRYIDLSLLRTKFFLPSAQIPWNKEFRALNITGKLQISNIKVQIVYKLILKRRKFEV